MSKVVTLTVREVATRLGVSTEHVRRLIRSGELRASNIGTTKRIVYRVREGALLRFLDAREVGAGACGSLSCGGSSSTTEEQRT